MLPYAFTTSATTTQTILSNSRLQGGLSLRHSSRRISAFDLPGFWKLMYIHTMNGWALGAGAGLPLACPHPTGECMVQALSPHLIQFLIQTLERRRGVPGSRPHTEDLERIPSSWPEPESALLVAGTRGVNEQTEDYHLALYLSN